MWPRKNGGRVTHREGGRQKRHRISRPWLLNPLATVVPTIREKSFVLLFSPFAFSPSQLEGFVSVYSGGGRKQKKFSTLIPLTPTTSPLLHAGKYASSAKVYLQYSRTPLISGLSNTLRGLDSYRSSGAAVCVDTVFLPPAFHRQKIGGGAEEKG